MRIYVTRHGLVMSRQHFVLVAWFVTAVLMFSLMSDTAVAEDETDESKRDDSAKVVQRPDRVSAMSTTTNASALTNYTESTEYGLPRAGSDPLGQNYGWLGAEDRSTDTIGGLTLMGVRLYNPITGRFLSMDPVAGGNDNAYTYPVDPINEFDVTGEFKIKWRKVGRHFKKHWKTYASVASMAVPGLGAAGAAYRGYRAYRTIRKLRKARKAICRFNSFVAGTDIEASDGRPVDIEDVDVGESVLSFDSSTGTFAEQSVTALIRGTGHKKLITIAVQTGSANATQEIVATDRHRFLTKDEQWVAAIDLHVGQRLVTKSGRSAVIAYIRVESRSAKVYNFTVAQWHTYMVRVGGDAVVVHNEKCKVTRKKKKGAAHTKNKRKSTKAKHEKGGARKKKDQGGEKGDKRRTRRK